MTGATRSNGVVFVVPINANKTCRDGDYLSWRKDTFSPPRRRWRLAVIRSLFELTFRSGGGAGAECWFDEGRRDGGGRWGGGARVDVRKP